jgi:hypothetical protein
MASSVLQNVRHMKKVTCAIRDDLLEHEETVSREVQASRPHFHPPRCEAAGLHTADTNADADADSDTSTVVSSPSATMTLRHVAEHQSYILAFQTGLDVDGKSAGITFVHGLWMNHFAVAFLPAFRLMKGKMLHHHHDHRRHEPLLRHEVARSCRLPSWPYNIDVDRDILDAVGLDPDGELWRHEAFEHGGCFHGHQGLPDLSWNEYFGLFGVLGREILAELNSMHQDDRFVFGKPPAHGPALTHHHIVSYLQSKGYNLINSFKKVKHTHRRLELQIQVQFREADLHKPALGFLFAKGLLQNQHHWHDWQADENDVIQESYPWCM